jgi:phosphatidate cytidylyltransferase
MLKQRLISGTVIGVTLILVANFLPPMFGWLLLMALAALIQIEFYAMMDQASIPVFRYVGIACGMVMISATYWTIGPSDKQLALSYHAETFVVFLTLMVLFIRQFPQKHNVQPITTIAATLLGIFYGPVLLNYFTRLTFAWRENGLEAKTVEDTGRMLLLYLVAVVKSQDIGAYFIGCKFGKHRLFPRLSPKKSWEGAVGGVASSLLASLLFWVLAKGQLGEIPLAWYHAVILGLIMPVAGILGDLFESLLKRSANVKDSGKIIPGMGGVLDVLDSLLFGAPLLYCYLRIFVV